MNLLQIPVSDVHAGKNWKVNFVEGADPNNPQVIESNQFSSEDLAVFSAAMKLADGSSQASIVLKSFPQEGATIATFVYTKMGWVNLQTEGIMRVMGKYSHDIFPYDVFLANPAEMDSEVGEKANEHRQVFQATLDTLKAIRYEQIGTQTRKRLMPGTSG